MAHDSNNKRIELIDAARGFAVVVMICYHIYFDIGLVFGEKPDFLSASFINVCLLVFPCIFFVISGICTAFSSNILKRGVLLFLIGEAITVITSVFFPSELILFGAISSIGCCMVIYYFAQKFFKKLPSVLIITVCVLLFVVFYDFAATKELNFLFKRVLLDINTESEYLYPFGIVYDGFHSADYFPLVPYFFVFLCGTALSRPIINKKLPQWFYSLKVPFLNKVGRYSLIIYIVHQPLIMATLQLIKYIKG